MKKFVSKSASNQKLKKVLKYGCILVLTVAVTLLLTFFLITPLMKAKLEKELLHSEIRLEEEAAYEKKDQEYVSAELETELRQYINEYFNKANVNECFSEKSIREFSELIAERLKEKEIYTISKEMIQQLLTKEIEKITAADLQNDEEKLLALKQELLEKISGIESQSTSIVKIAQDVKETKISIEQLQEVLSEVIWNLGDCTVSYHADDGHFYITYEKEGADSVTKKLDYAE